MDNHNSFYPLLDLSQIDMLLDCGDEESFEMFSEILDLFEQESSAKFAELKEAKTSGDAYILLDEIGLDLKETMKQLRAYLAQA